MKIIIKKIDIIDVLSSIQGLTNRKTNLAITKNVILRTTDSEVIISATDLDTGFEGTYPAIIEKKGTIAINGKKFFEIIRDFPSEDIVINEIENRWIKIGDKNDKNIEFHIVGSDYTDFPEIPVIEDISFITIDSSKIKKMINVVNIIQSLNDEKRGHIIGVKFEKVMVNDEKLIRMVSTDSKRLVKIEYSYENEEDFSDEEAVLIPKKGLIDVGKFLDEFGTVQVGTKNDHFILKKDNEIILVKLLEGKFPKYESLLEIDEEFAIEFNKNIFQMLLKRMSILASEEYNSVVFHFENNKLVVTATNPDIGESREEIPINFSRESIEVCFNPRFFIDIFNNINDEIIILYIEDAETPCRVKGENDKDMLNVIMPIKI